MSSLTNCRHDQRGNALAEFTWAVPLLIVGMFGMFDCARAIYDYNLMFYMAQVATRHASVNSATLKATSENCPRTGNANADMAVFICPKITGVDPTQVTVTTTLSGTSTSGTTCTNTAAVGCTVNVSIAYTYEPVILAGQHSIPINGTSQAVILY